MKDYNLKQSFVIVVAGFALLWACLYYFVFPYLVGGGPEKIPRAQNDERQLFLSMENYKQEFGDYPTGSNSNIVKVLTGGNSKNLVFLIFKRATEHSNEMFDPWGTPYRIEFSQQTNFIIRSTGKDGIFGDADDIIFNSLSNDFVKP